MVHHESPLRSDPIHASVPANILIAGEYAILEEGGLGLAVAVEARADGWATHAQTTQIKGTSPAGTFAYPGDPFLERVVRHLQSTGTPAAHDVRVDTSAFFSQDGSKRGFGSSAATTVLITALLGGGSPESIAALATEAHRAGQDGRGSGYDVWASAMGGTTLFHGGAHPFADSIALDWLGAIVLFQGAAPVRTPGAVGRYNEWKRADPEAARGFLNESNAAVEGLVRATTIDAALSAFAECRRIGIKLGQSIGVPAEIEIPEPAQPSLLAPAAFKAVGAGNELGVGLAAMGATESVFVVSEEGLRWE